mmetsp:Transcript_35215/g.69114  ORF Transcript_35215/g.69114 Transcript_35215/m.69114 type:complete len:262 (+) Transcript_35215:857-1642(+)
MLSAPPEPLGLLRSSDDLDADAACEVADLKPCVRPGETRATLSAPETCSAQFSSSLSLKSYNTSWLNALQDSSCTCKFSDLVWLHSAAVSSRPSIALLASAWELRAKLTHNSTRSATGYTSSFPASFSARFLASSCVYLIRNNQLISSPTLRLASRSRSNKVTRSATHCFAISFVLFCDRLTNEICLLGEGALNRGARTGSWFGICTGFSQGASTPSIGICRQSESCSSTSWKWGSGTEASPALKSEITFQKLAFGSSFVS